MKYLPRCYRACLLLAGTASILTPGLFAQAAASSPPAQANSNEILTLPEFSVEANTEIGAYTAGDTVSASRMNAAVKDLPYSTESMTQQLLADFQIFNLNEDLSYMSAVTGNSDAFTFSIRGYNSANVALFNGHYMFNPVVAPFVDRVEIIKGPAGSLYGQSAPGGVILITTRQPTSAPENSVSASVGSSYDFHQEQIHSSGPIPLLSGDHPKLFYNVDAEYLHRTYDVHYARRQEKAVEGGLTYRLDENTNVSIEGVWQKIWNPNAADWGLPLEAHFANNPDTGKPGQIFYDGFAWPLRHEYYGSTVDYVTREASTYYATLQHRFNDVLSLEAGFSHYVTPVETYNTLGSSGVYFPAANLVANATAVSGTNNVNPNATTNPAWSTTMGTGYSYNIDLLSHFQIGRHIDNQALFTIDDFLNNRRNYTETPIAGTFTPFVWAFNPFAPVTSPYIPRDSAHWSSATTLNNAVNSLGGGINDRLGLFDGKVILTFGYRHDHYTGYQLNPNASLSAVAYTGAAPGSGRESHIFSDNDGANFGVTYQLTPVLSWYSSVYQAFTPFNTSVPLTVTLNGTNAFAQQQQLKTLNPPPQKGVGEETGFKLDYLNHSVFFTLDAFTTQQRNVSVSELSDPTNPSSTVVSVPEGDQDAKGIEFTGGYNKGGFAGVLSYSYNDAKVENQGINVLANGRRPRGSPMHSISANLSYSVPRVTGLRLLTSVHYQGSAPEQSPSTGGILNAVTGLDDQNNGEMYLMTPAYAVWNFGAIYGWKSEGLAQSVNLMVKNAFNRQYLPSTNTTLFVGDGRGLYLTYTIRH